MNACKIWYLYIVRCARGALYTGISPDVQQRIAKHNSGRGARCMKLLGTPVELVYTEKVGCYRQALRREREVKRFTRKQKEMLCG